MPLEKLDAKSIWEKVKAYLPCFALFQSDRQSTDADSEVQDPMKLAVKAALKKVENEVAYIKDFVRREATKVAEATLEKLKEMDPELANELVPEFSAEPKLDNVFKLTLQSDNNIPVNKRGSGVRRLILLNFFRAQVERQREEASTQTVIYAIEEPETSQHPNNQKMLIDTFRELSQRNDCQVILTTHVPELASLAPTGSLRYVTEDGSGKQVLQDCDDVYQTIADELGVLPDSRIQVLVCVEGPNDVEFLLNVSTILQESDKSYPDLVLDRRVAIIPLGGGTLRQWVNKQYLKNLRIPEVHIYDNDVSKYKQSCDAVNSRDDGSVAFLTSKRCMENYIHARCVNEYFGIEIGYGDSDDVPELIVNAVKEASGGEFTPINKKRAKSLLNTEVVRKMTLDMLEEIDHNKDIKKWFDAIKERLH